MEEVMGQVVADVPKYTATKYGDSRIPVVEEDCVGKLPEWGCQDNEESGWHDQAVFVHGQIVMNSVKQEVKSETDSIVRKPPKRVSWCHCKEDNRACTCQRGRESGASGTRSKTKGKHPQSSTQRWPEDYPGQLQQP